MAALRPVPPPEPPTSSGELEAEVAAIREQIFSPRNYLAGRLGLLATRPLGLELNSTRGAAVTGLVMAALRVLLPLTAGLIAGDLGESPVGRWVLIAGLLGTLDAVTTRRMGKHTQEQLDLTSLLETIERPSDAHALLLFTRRRYHLGVSLAAAACLSVLATITFALVAPEALDALPVGSVVLLTILVFEMGEFAYSYVGLMIPFIARMATYDHRLFWFSPLDSDPVRRTLHSLGGLMTFVGFSSTQYLVLGVVLVSADSGLFLPVVVTFTLTGYATIALLLMGVRRSLRVMATRNRDQHLALLRVQLEDFGPRLGELTAAEADELRHLAETYRTVRETPTTPSTSEAFGHAAKALVIPTLGFLLAVMSEVYAERILNQLLP
jgi:hypothetical protein